jgi:hypothetical protein
VDKVALGQVFSEHFRFPCQFSFHRLLPHWWPAYQVGCLTPMQEIKQSKETGFIWLNQDGLHVNTVLDLLAPENAGKVHAPTRPRRRRHVASQGGDSRIMLRGTRHGGSPFREVKLRIQQTLLVDLPRPDSLTERSGVCHSLHQHH